jgi:hypothetical protein
VLTAAATLRVAAEFAAARPAAPLADLVSELTDRQQRLDVGGDQHSSARTVFSWFCQHLDQGPARAFRLASMHPGPDMHHYALTATTSAHSRRMLEVLEQAHLIQSARPGRYSMHDLLSAYASELAAMRETPASGDHPAVSITTYIPPPRPRTR